MYHSDTILNIIVISEKRVLDNKTERYTYDFVTVDFCRVLLRSYPDADFEIKKIRRYSDFRKSMLLTIQKRTKLETFFDETLILFRKYSKNSKRPDLDELDSALCANMRKHKFDLLSDQIGNLMFMLIEKLSK